MAKAKTTEKRRRLEAQEHGGVLVRGGTPGIGRPVEAMRRACREAFAEKQGVQFVARVMAGEETEDVTVTIGSGKDARTEVKQVRPKLRDRLYAAELLMEHGHGKAPQEVKIEAKRPRRTGEESIARIMELLPRVIPMLPAGRQEIARAFAEQRQIEVLVEGKEVNG